MQINVIYDQSQSSLPAGFVAAVNYVVNYFDTTFTNPVTVNIDLGYGEIAGQSLGTGALGESETYFDSVAYSQAVNALKANQPSATQQAAYSTLPGSSPVSGGTLWASTSEEKALGLLAGNNSAIDGYVGLSSSYPFSYGSATPACGQYYFDGVLAHEFSEVLGRTSLLGDGLGGTNSYALMDLFRYAAPGARQLGTGGPAYFSIDNGATNLRSWNTNPNGDLGDWAGSAGADSFLAFSPSGQIDWVTQPDVTLMNVLGWDTSPLAVAAVVTASSRSVAYNQSVPLTNIFSVSGSGITQYQVWFSYPEGGAPALGTVTNNGTAIALDQPVTLSSLGGLAYIGSAAHGTDKIWLKAFNGSWSGWTDADVTDPGVPAPSVTPTNRSVADNQSVALTNIFSVSGTGITQYQVWFSYAEGGAPALGTLTNNGTAIALDQPVTLSSLGGLAYTGSAAHGTDKIWLQAFNGTWSGWTEADITDSGLITPNNQAVAYNQTVPLTSVFSVSGGGITQYQVWFSYPEGGAPAVGTVTNNGTTIALDQPVTMSSLSGLAYTGSAVHGTDKIWVQAFNGSWTGWTEADITDPGLPAPSITPNNQAVAYNQPVALTNVFAVSGNGITQYQVWFSYAEGGAPALGAVTNNGTPIALDQPVTLNSLSGLAYTGSAAHGTDKIWLKAFNGSWSGWSEADITDPGLITPHNQPVAYNQTIPLTNIFSVSSNGITQYQVWFSYPEGGAPAVGTVTNNGTPIALDQPVTLSSLGGLAYTGSAAHGTDKIWLQAFNGSWSGWTEADITDPGLPAPSITPNNRTVADNQSVPLTNIFSVSGTGITQYQVWFSYAEGAAPAVGTLTNNGTPIALDQPVTLGSIGGLTYTGSAAHGTDKIWLKAFNGTWSGWSEADITDPGLPAPSITPSSQAVAANQPVALTNIFSVSGTGITQYQVWFSYSEGGAPALGTVTNNGTPIALDQPVTLSSLSGLAYTGSVVHGTDKVWLQAFNGTWSGWSEADITDLGGSTQAASAPLLAPPAEFGPVDPGLLNNYMAAAFASPATYHAGQAEFHAGSGDSSPTTLTQPRHA